MFEGVGTALATPFNEDFSIDFESYKKLIRRQIEGGIDYVIVLGTTGESPVIDEYEREKLIETAMEAAESKLKIVIGTGSNDTSKVVKLNAIAEKYKIDAVLIVNPYYNKGTQSSLVQHYKYISERTSLPIILYNVPSRTGMNLLPETAIKINESCKNVVAIKEASGDISQIARLSAMKQQSFEVISGNDDQTIPIMALGGVGVISVYSNAFPKELKEITTAMQKNDLQKAQALNQKYLKMINLLFEETSPSPLKFVLSKLGICKNILRMPLAPVSERTENLLLKELENYEKY
ncbi:MAG: 4-hydroxy-tetrahydrodipicolinate synthase [Ignavibacteriaceae bacterium]|jgi:4-hydroxy-tetrahydrodipicolinate synthase|nr:4-hydroxy-tetrahydrodipicolinate synthase [Ignavibacteriaceae bacterium]